MLTSTDPDILPAHNVKMPTIVVILTFMSRTNTILGLSELEKAAFLGTFILEAFKSLCSAKLGMYCFFITS